MTSKEPETRPETVSDGAKAYGFGMEQDQRVTSFCDNRIGELLDDLQREAELGYISDIPYAANKDHVISAIERLKAEDYPAKQWKEALLYILKRRH
mgnify:CR=1 FL=1